MSTNPVIDAYREDAVAYVKGGMGSPAKIREDLGTPEQVEKAKRVLIRLAWLRLDHPADKENPA